MAAETPVWMTLFARVGRGEASGFRRQLRMHAASALLAVALSAVGPAAWAANSVYLEELTWTEVRAAIRAERTTILIPVGGTEQNGPHMALGKHNTRARALAGLIATSLGTALVAPVVAYVPEGRLTPPTGHMRFAGTISVPEPVFTGVLDAAARSFRQHGFVDVVFLGDSGNYQSQLKTVVARLNRDWAATPARAHYIADYYHAAQVAFPKMLLAKGLSEKEIGGHAGSADTSLLLTLDASMVRSDRLAFAASEGKEGGTDGDPRAASAGLGKIGVELIVAQSVAAIRSAQAHR